MSDTAAMHPTVLAPLGHTPPSVDITPHDVANLLFGLFSRCAVQSAGYLTDYVVKAGVLVNVAGPNWRAWVDLAVRVGYLTPTVIDDGPAWLLLDDPTNLVHIRLRDDIEWEAQRKRDTANPSLVVPVRLRDGDGCRYCGRVVTWGDQRGGRGGTYDHRVPGQPAATPDDLRVACRMCNSRRGARPDADDRVPPLPAPASPHYGPKTAALLAEHGHRVPRSRTPRSGAQPDTARTTATPPPSGHRPRTEETARLVTEPNTAPARLVDIQPPTPATMQPRYVAKTSTPRPDGTPSDTAPRDPATGRTPRHLDKPQDHFGLVNSANRQGAEPGSSGRVGTGREATPSTPSRRKRGRRGKDRRPGQSSPGAGATDHVQQHDDGQPAD